MYRVVKIGEKEVPMLSMASVDVYYRNVFHKDANKIQLSDSFDEGDMINFLTEMAFIMAKFAELKERKLMASLNEEMFLDWLDGFDRFEFFSAMTEIRLVYEGQSVTNADAKKNEEALTEE